MSLYFADQIGLTPEEVISKIMANPEVAMAFQNPRVQAAIMDVCIARVLRFNLEHSTLLFTHSLYPCAKLHWRMMFRNTKRVAKEKKGNSRTGLTSEWPPFLEGWLDWPPIMGPNQ